MDSSVVLICAFMACVVVFGLGCISLYLGHQRRLEADKNARIIAVEEEKTNRARVAAGREFVNAQLEAGVFNQSQTSDEGGLGNLMQYLQLLQNRSGGGAVSGNSFPGSGGDAGSTASSSDSDSTRIF